MMENHAVQKTEALAQGVFAKLGLHPTEAFCCCAPNMCGLRAVVVVIAWLQTVYACCVLLVSGFSTLASAIWLIANLQILSFVLLLLTFVFQFIIACLYLITGIYGIKATRSLQAITNLSPEVVKATQLYYKLNLVSFLAGLALGIILTILQSIAVANAVSIVFIWIWYIAYVALAAYVLFTIWSYSQWITKAANGDPTALGKAVKLGTAAPPPPTAEPVVHKSEQTAV